MSDSRYKTLINQMFLGRGLMSKPEQRGLMFGAPRHAGGLLGGYQPDPIPPQYRAAAMLNAVGAGPVNMLSPGNIDIFNRVPTQLPGGATATVRSGSFQNNNGEEVLIPTIGPNGEDLTWEQAKQLYGLSGKHLGKFGTWQAADYFAQKLHEQQEKQYVRKKP